MAFKASFSNLFLISAAPWVGERGFPSPTHSLKPSAKATPSGKPSRVLQKKGLLRNSGVQSRYSQGLGTCHGAGDLGAPAREVGGQTPGERLMDGGSREEAVLTAPNSPSSPGASCRVPRGGGAGRGHPEGAGAGQRAGPAREGPSALARQRLVESRRPSSARGLGHPYLSAPAKPPSPAPDGEGPGLLSSLSVVSPPRPAPPGTVRPRRGGPASGGLRRGGAGALRWTPTRHKGASSPRWMPETCTRPWDGGPRGGPRAGTEKPSFLPAIERVEGTGRRAEAGNVVEREDPRTAPRRNLDTDLHLTPQAEGTELTD